MADVAPLTASEAIQNHIKTLGLRDFPCGTGSWRQMCDLLKATKKEQLKPGSLEKRRSDCLLKEEDEAEKETNENLIEFIISSSSPWYLDYSWSKEAKGLREIAIQSPRLINPDFVYSYFRTLNIADKAVTDVDDGLLRLKNLEELTLSANFITNVNSKYLPSTLKVLELCANNINSISELCKRPPPLQHLGLGRNRISVVGKYISRTYWPYLVSLDLSHNDLSGLVDIVETLGSLPDLRNLLLQGNPVCLIAGYRGYVIDCLQDLTIFDDKYISVDEKYHFSGLASRKEDVLDEAKIRLGVTCVRGLPCPAEVMFPDIQPEFPIIERSYFVQFMFPMEFREETDVQIIDNFTDGVHLQTDDENEPSKLPSVLNQANEDLENVDLETDGKKKSVLSAADVSERLEASASTVRKDKEAEVRAYTKLVSINSHPQPWGDKLFFNWKTDIVERDLLFLRDFFRTGMDVNVVQQIIEAYPVGSDISSDHIGDTKEKDQKDKKKNKTQKKEKMLKPVVKEVSKEKPKKKKLAGEDLVKSPPTFSTVASFHVPLDRFLNGEHDYQDKLVKPSVSTGSEANINALEDISFVKQKTDTVNSIKPDEKKHTRNKESDKKNSKGRIPDETGNLGTAWEVRYMPRGGRAGGGGRSFGGSGTPRPSSPRSPPARRDHQTSPPQQPRFGGPRYNQGPGIGGVIAGSFLGSALGSVLGNAISHRMYDGRNPETGAWEDPSRPDDNPCKKELDYFLDCSKYSSNQSYCKSPANELKRCAEKHKDYFEDTDE